LGTLVVIKNSFKDLLIKNIDPRHPKLYYFITKAWYESGSLFFNTPPPYFLKLLPFAFGLGTYFLLLQNLKNISEKTYFSLIYLTSPSIFIFFQELRPYSMMTFFLALAFISLEKGQSIRACLWSLIALGSHHLSALFITIFLIFEFIDERERRDKYKLVLIPFLIASYYHLLQTFLNLKGQNHKQIILNIKQFIIYFSQFFDPLESLSLIEATLVSLFVLGVILYIELFLKKRRSTSEKTFLTLLPLFWFSSLLTINSYSSPKYNYLIIFYFPYYLVRNLTPQRLRYLAPFLLALNIYIICKPNWGLIDFEHRPKYKEAFQSLRGLETKKVIKLCHRWNEYLPGHFEYYPELLGITNNVVANDCHHVPFHLPSKNEVFIVLKNSPWWKAAKEQAKYHTFKSRRLIIIQPLPSGSTN